MYKILPHSSTQHSTAENGIAQPNIRYIRIHVSALCVVLNERTVLKPHTATYKHTVYSEHTSRAHSIAYNEVR